MALISITTTQEEQQAVLDFIKSSQGTPLSISTIAKHTNMKQSRVRYTMMDLVDSGKVKRKVHKAYNSRYIRYTYETV